MMKKLKWKQFFARKRSKSRNKTTVNTEACNVCQGSPLVDINSLCDRHRDQPADKSNSRSSGILKVTKHAVSNTKEKTEELKAEETSVNAPDQTRPQLEENPIGSTVEPVSVSGTEVAGEKSEGTPNTQTARQQDQIGQGKSDKVEVNEDFMAEEIDSTHLSEQSGTENTVPIVIEPVVLKNENENRGGVCEDSSIKSRISFTSLQPTKTFEIPTKEEINATDVAENRKGTELPFVLRNRKKRALHGEELAKWQERNAAVKLANEAWFRKDVCEVWVDEDDEVNAVAGEVEDEAEGQDDVVVVDQQANEKEAREEDQMDEHCAVSGTNTNISGLADQNVEPEDQADGRIIDNDVAEELQTLQFSYEEDDPLKHSFSAKTVTDSPSPFIHQANVELVPSSPSESTEPPTAAIPFPGFPLISSPSDQTRQPTSDNHPVLGISQYSNDMAPEQNVTQTPDMQLILPEQEMSEVQAQIPRMVFGAISVDFSNQQTLYSPNFGAQGTDPNDPSDQEKDELQYPYLSIYKEMRNILTPKDESAGSASQITDAEVGKVVRISSFNDDANSDVQPEDPEQIPPSLDVDNEEEISSQSPTEEHKELTRE